jgi:predicted aminopeptidase
MIRCLKIALCVLWLPLSGCYYLQVAQGQMAVLARREPISKVLAQPDIDAQLRKRLEYVQAARVFASSALGLPDNRSYTAYADIKRRYVSWNVFAAPEFSVEPKRWCFPVAGCVVYRGYFSEAAAQRYAVRLRVRGYDAAVSGVPAYSTLGHFDDPVLSSMFGWSDAQIAATLFHELAHQVVYVSDDSAFNESFATVVEQVGLERWLMTQQRNSDWQSWQAQRQRAEQFSALLLRARERLRTWYDSGANSEVLLAGKQQRLGELKFEYSQLRQSWQGYNGYDHWFDRALSNADFVAIATYQRCVPAFERLLDSVSGDLPRFYDEVKKMARQDKLTRQRLCQEG